MTQISFVTNNGFSQPFELELARFEILIFSLINDTKKFSYLIILIEKSNFAFFKFQKRKKVIAVMGSFFC